MTALHIWALAAGGAVLGLPVIIHLLTRARGTPFFYPTIRFVQEAVVARRRVSRLRDILLLLLRTLAVAAIAGAFARPLLRSQEVAAMPSPAGGRWVVIILRASVSLDAQGEGATPFAIAHG